MKGKLRFRNTWASMDKTCWDITLFTFWYESWGDNDNGDFQWECNLKILGFSWHYDNAALAWQEAKDIEKYKKTPTVYKFVKVEHTTDK